MLGEISQSGEDAPPDPVMAAEFWRKAADLGHVGALHRLGEAHEQGLGLDADLDAAVAFYRDAASKGYVNRSTVSPCSSTRACWSSATRSRR